MTASNPNTPAGDPPAPTGSTRATSAEGRAGDLLLLIDLVARLRAPDGCAWDRALTLRSLAPNLTEEVHELVEAIETGNPAAEREEAGDLLLNLVMLCQISTEQGRFGLFEAATSVADKLVRRHPHVFGSAAREGLDAIRAQGAFATPDANSQAAAGDASDARAALHQWEAIKRAERQGKLGDSSALAGVPKGLPAVQRAQRLGAKAIAAGFRWNDPYGAFAKVEEELNELASAFAAAGALPMDALAQNELAHELGDLMLAAAQFANYVGIDAEAAARAASRRFEARFRHMERALGGHFDGRTLEEMMAAWREAKALQ